jgi:hypothetical protein
MWEPRRLTTFRASTACYRDTFTFFDPKYFTDFVSLIRLAFICFKNRLAVTIEINGRDSVDICRAFYLETERDSASEALCSVRDRISVILKWWDACFIFITMAPAVVILSRVRVTRDGVRNGGSNY